MPDIMTPAQEFETPAEALAHYGKKGMKWGVRNDTDKAKAAIGRTKPTTKEIHNARAKIASKERRLNLQIDKTNLAEGRQQKTEAKKLSEISTDFLKDPDRATALRITNGEKVMLGFLAVGIPGAGTGVAAGVSGGRLAVRKSVERQQRKMAS